MQDFWRHSPLCVYNTSIINLFNIDFVIFLRFFFFWFVRNIKGIDIYGSLNYFKQMSGPG